MRTSHFSIALPPAYQGGREQRRVAPVGGRGGYFGHGRGACAGVLVPCVRPFPGRPAVKPDGRPAGLPVWTISRDAAGAAVVVEAV